MRTEAGKNKTTLLENIHYFFSKGLAPDTSRRKPSCMNVVSKKKQRRPVRRARAHGVKIITKARPMTTDEIISLVEKARMEKDAGKRRQITDKIIDGFYGRKTVVI
jgi:hypothetical protein